MEQKKIGSFEFGPLAFGGNVLGWTADEKTSFELLDTFVGEGFNFVDTADVYSAWVPGNKGGESETILGNWFSKTKKRDKVILATKLGMELSPDKKGLSRKYIFKAVEDSLKRLKTDYIDLYQAHRDDPETPLAETLEAFNELITQGKIRAIGASNYSGARLQEAIDCSKKNGWASYQSLQPSYHLCDRVQYESDLQPVCKKNNLAVITYYSLASGFLTGKYHSEKDLENKKRGSRVKKYFTPQGFRILEALEKVAALEKATPTEVALAWILSNPTITAPIASATQVSEPAKRINAGGSFKTKP